MVPIEVEKYLAALNVMHIELLSIRRYHLSAIGGHSAAHFIVSRALESTCKFLVIDIPDK